MRFEKLDDWLRWQESLHSSEIDMGLARVREVASRMGLLRPQARVVTVAGTNGKGSCVASLQSLLSVSGFRVASYTSPHLLKYNERIRLDGKPVSDQLICAAFERIDQARRDPLKGDISLTYFEFGTLAAIEVAASQAVDFLVLEVGLGGRLDAVNIIDAEIAVVTSIAQDHDAWLGTDIEVIGREKAGVFRAGRPAICASEDVPASVAAYAAEVGAHFMAAGAELNWQVDGVRWDFTGLGPERELVNLADLPLPSLPLPSVAAALQVLLLLGVGVESKHRQCLADLTLPGRAQRVERDGVSIILDVGHNPAAAEFLAAYLKVDNTTSTGKIYFVIAMMADKDAVAVLASLLPLAAGVFLADLPGNLRAATARALNESVSASPVLSPQTLASENASVEMAIDAALLEAKAGDKVVVMGSFFTVAEALSYLNL